MNDTNLILSTNEDFSFINVQFYSNTEEVYRGKNYAYKTTESFNVGDFAIVESPYSGFTVVEVKETNVTPRNNYEYKWVVQKLDTTRYEHNKDVEKVVSQHLNTVRLGRLRKEATAAMVEEIGQEEFKNVTALLGDLK